MSGLLHRLLPAPRLTLVLLVTWLLLNESVHPAQIVLGTLIALAVPWLTLPLQGTLPGPRNWGLIVRLAGVVLLDIVRANIQVARRILGPESAIHPRFVWVPLSIRNPHGIATLAGIITMTPGTLSSDISPDRRHLLVHAFDVDDEQALVAEIKQRYEAPLMAIFDS